MWKSLTAVWLCTLFAIPAFGQTTMQHIGLPAPTAAGGVFLNVVHEAGAAEVAMASANTFYVMDTSINATEVKDVTNEFSVSASQDEVCYTGTDSIEVEIVARTTFSMTTNTGTLTFALGQNTTGAIVDGDEISLGLSRVVGAAGAILGSVSASTTLATSDCISLMAASSAATSGVTMLGFSMTITEPGTGGSGDSAVAGSDSYIQYNCNGNHCGTANATLDSSGNATFRRVTTDDIDGDNAVVLLDNPGAGYTTSLAGSVNALGLHADSSTQADRVFYDDDAGVTWRLAVTSGNMEFSATDTLTAVQMYGGRVIVTTGSFIIHLPAAVEGMNACFYTELAASVLSINPDDGDHIILYNSGPLADGQELDSPGSIGASVCLLANSDGNWMMIQRLGGWIGGSL